MIIKLELFGMSREFSKDEFLHFEFDNEITVKDLRIKLEQMIKNEFRRCTNYDPLCEVSCCCLRPIL